SGAHHQPRTAEACLSKRYVRDEIGPVGLCQALAERGLLSEKKTVVFRPDGLEIDQLPQMAPARRSQAYPQITMHAGLAPGCFRSGHPIFRGCKRHYFPLPLISIEQRLMCCALP